MTNTIINQLQAVTATEIKFSPEDVTVIIPKTVKILSSSVKIGSIYDIKLSNFVTNPPPDSTLADNWNSGRIPQFSEYTVEIQASLGNMIKINGVAIQDNTSNFFGWIPKDGFEVTKKY